MDKDWRFTQQSIAECLENNCQRSIALEGLVLDLRVVSADLRGSHAMLSNIVKHLQELEVSPLELQSLLKNQGLR